jgi:hypothetical protein
MTTETEAITLAESKRLIALEKTIERGTQTFVEVGLALAEIRDSKLYRCDYDSFEMYCSEKWGWKRRYAYNLIEAAGVVQSLPENVRHGAQTERQARALAQVEPDQRAEVLEQAQAAAESEGRPLAARDIAALTPQAIRDQQLAARLLPQFESGAAEPAHIQTLDETQDNKRRRALLTEINVAIADLEIVRDKIDKGENDPDALDEVAKELSLVVKGLHKLAKEMRS